jgi:hypothetical protein
VTLGFGIRFWDDGLRRGWCEKAWLSEVERGQRIRSVVRSEVDLATKYCRYIANRLLLPLHMVDVFAADVNLRKPGNPPVVSKSEWPPELRITERYSQVMS